MNTEANSFKHTSSRTHTLVWDYSYSQNIYSVKDSKHIFQHARTKVKKVSTKIGNLAESQRQSSTAQSVALGTREDLVSLPSVTSWRKAVWNTASVDDLPSSPLSQKFPNAKTQTLPCVSYEKLIGWIHVTVSCGSNSIRYVFLLHIFKWSVFTSLPSHPIFPLSGFEKYRMELVCNRIRRARD